MKLNGTKDRKVCTDDNELWPECYRLSGLGSRLIVVVNKQDETLAVWNQTISILEHIGAVWIGS